MKTILSAAFCLVFLFIPFFVFGQNGFGISSAPEWVRPVLYSDSITDFSSVSGGYYYLLYDEQVNAERKEIYNETVIKILSDKGLSFASVIDQSYDPAFQKLNFHSVYIQRGNTRIDKLVKNDFAVIQREKDISRAVYDGSLSAILNLIDVQAGDIVGYSFTTTGRNPVFGDHFFADFYFNAGASTGKTSFRLVVSPKRKLNFKWFGDKIEAIESKQDGLNVFTFEKENINSINYEDQVPAWYPYYNQLQVSDFKDWTELWAWESTLFKSQGSNSKALQRLIDSLKSIPDKEARAIAATRIVQDKIRYFSLSNGISGYVPHAPSRVLDNKFGDCKDKSFLLSTILTQTGIESYPVLVHSSKGKSLDQKLPSPLNFDHVIVQFKFNDSLYYVDPTISFQRGRLAELSTPDYYFGVVFDPKQAGLTTIPTPVINQALIRGTEEFDIGETGAPVRLKVSTVYTGSRANDIRDYRKSNSISELNQKYLNFYAGSYPLIKLSKSVEFNDDSVTNRMTVDEEYTIPDFWKYDEKKSHYEAELSADLITSYQSIPSSRIRSMPLRLEYPLDVELIRNIRLPEDWDVEDLDNVVKGPGFVFHSESSHREKTIRLVYSLYHTSSFIEASEIGEYLNKIDEVYEHVGYQLTHRKLLTTEKGSSDRGLMIVIITIVFVCGAVCYKLYRYDPYFNVESDEYREPGIFIILSIIGITITPIKALIDVTNGAFLDLTVRHVFVDPAADVKLTIYVISKICTYVMLMSLAVLSFLLAWKRRTSAPLFIMIFYVLNFLALGLLILIGSMYFDMHPGYSDMRTLTLGGVLAVACVPYVLLSKDIKETFRRRLRG